MSENVQGTRQSSVAGILPARPAGGTPATRSEGGNGQWVSALASPGDIDALLDLESRCFAQGVALTRRQFRHLLKSPCATTHVLRRHGRIVGDAMILRRRTRGGTLGRLYSMAVDQAFRGQGLGRLLLADCLEALRRDAVPAVVLEVHVENAAAIRLYESAGFTRTRRLADYYAAGSDAWKMRLELNGATRVAGVSRTGADPGAPGLPSLGDATFRGRDARDTFPGH